MTRLSPTVAYGPGRKGKDTGRGDGERGEMHANFTEHFFLFFIQ